MKKIIALMMAVLLIMPLAIVNAATYKQYTVGEEVNFYVYDGDQTGVTTFILEDKGTEDQYVRTFVAGFGGLSSQGYADALVTDPTNFKTTLAYKNLMDKINMEGRGFPHARNVAEEVSLLSLDDLKNIFGATPNEDGSVYTIDAAKYGKVFEVIPLVEKGIFTSTVEEGKVWVVKFTYDDVNSSNRKITGLSVEKENLDTDIEYYLVPVVYFDKTYDCHYKEMGPEYSCYDCNGDYSWVEVGKQAETCKLVPDILIKEKCVKSPKTGIEEYALEFAIVAIICGISLIFIKRKDLFKEI